MRGGPALGGEIGWWAPSRDEAGRGTGTLHDLSGNGNHGTLVGMDAATDWVQDGGANGRYALDFDGTNDWVDMGDVLNQGAGAFSVSAWIKLKSTAPVNIAGRIIQKRGTGAAGTQDGWQLCVYRSGAQALVNNCIWDGATAFHAQPQNANTFLLGPVEQWLHLVSLFDVQNGSWRFYGGGVLAIKTIAYRIVVFGNSVVHLFTQELPAAFRWLADNGLDILMRLAANALTLFENLGSNIVKVFSNLPGLISGKVKLGDLLTPLNRGMIDVVENALELPVRIEGEVERALREDMEKLQSELSGGLATHVSKRLEELVPSEAPEAPKVETPTIKVEEPDLSANKKQVENQFAQLAERGSQEYRDSILRFRGLGQAGEDTLQKEQRDIARQQLDELKRANKLAAQITPTKLVTIGG